MGNPEYSAPKEPKVSEQFVEWLNATDFKNDEQLTIALIEIKDECAVRLSAMEEEASATPEVEQP